MTDIVALLTAQAVIEGWKSAIGVRDITVYLQSGLDLTDGSLALLIFLPDFDPQIESGYWSRYNETIILTLIRKFEEETFSSVGETTEQKYNNRLYEIRG